MHADAAFFIAQNKNRFSVGLYFDTWTVLLAVVMGGAAIWWIYWASSRNRAKLLLAPSCVSLRTSVFPSARSHGRTRLPVDGFSWNFIFEYFLESPSRKSMFNKNMKINSLLYMKCNIHFWWQFTKFFW